MPIQPPDRRRDDILFGDLFLGNGSRTALAQYMGIKPSNVTQQLDPDNPDRSYFHAGKLALYAADTMDAVDGGARGDVLWNDLVESRAKWLGRRRDVLLKFPARLAHECIEVELNTAELDQIPVGRRREMIRRLIADLESYEAGMLMDGLEDDGADESSRGGDGRERVGREADTPEPQTSAARM